MAYLSEPQLSETQHDVLAEVIPQDAVYFPSSPIPSKTSRLKTQQKVIVRAINEVFDKAGTVETSTNNALNTIFSLFGNFLIDTNLQTNAQKIAPTVLEAIAKLSTDISGDLDNPIVLPKAANEMILEAHKVVEFIEEIYFDANQNTTTILTEETDIYLLDEDNIKWKKDVDFIVENQEIQLLLTLPYNMFFKIYKN